MGINFKIDRDKWKIVLATVRITQQSVCEAIGIDKAAFSSRLKTGGKFSSKEIKIISDLINVDPLSFIIDELGLSEVREPPSHYVSPNVVTMPKEAYDSMVYQINELKRQLEDCKNQNHHEPSDNT